MGSHDGCASWWWWWWKESAAGWFNSTWWRVVGKGYVGVEGLEVGNEWDTRVRETGQKSKTEPPSFGFGERNMGGFVFGSMKPYLGGVHRV